MHSDSGGDQILNYLDFLVVQYLLFLVSMTNQLIQEKSFYKVLETFKSSHIFFNTIVPMKKTSKTIQRIAAPSNADLTS
jgi:hypothetical protein